MIRTALIFVILILAACGGYQYVPLPQYAPVNSEKGTLNAGLSFNHVHLGYAFDDNYSIFISGLRMKNGPGFFGSFFNDKENSGDTLTWDKFRRADAGISFFHHFNNHFSYEILLGGGMGTAEYSSNVDWWPSDYSFDFKAKHYNLFIQPNLTINFSKLIKIDEVLDLTFMPCLRFNHYNDISKTLELNNDGRILQWDKYLINRNNDMFLVFFEPGLQLRLGWKQLTFFGQFNGAFDLFKTGIHYKPVGVFAGVSLNLNMLKK
ncbi:MAG: hypothetical protein JXB00_20935 [Bacteroidales bacterium]|nr:hypothetical protein [Bacteroidales bacterium]